MKNNMEYPVIFILGIFGWSPDGDELPVHY